MFVIQKCVSVRLFNIKTLFFPEICTFEFTVHQGKPTMNWFFRYQSMSPVGQKSMMLNQRMAKFSSLHQ